MDTVEKIDTNKLAALAKEVDHSLFNLHDYLRRGGDEFWREFYRHRVEVNMLADARKQYHIRALLQPLDVNAEKVIEEAKRHALINQFPAGGIVFRLIDLASSAMRRVGELERQNASLKERVTELEKLQSGLQGSLEAFKEHK